MSTALKFGATIYLKLIAGDGLWLSGGRSDGHQTVVTRDGEDRSMEENYQWHVQESPTRAGSRIINYGDVIYLRLSTEEPRWLRSRGGSSVVTRDGEGWSAPDAYRWRIHKHPISVGSGPVDIDDVVYLSPVASPTLFLSGGRGNGNEVVVTRDGEGWDDTSVYRWTIRDGRPEACVPRNPTLVDIEAAFANIREQGNERAAHGTVPVYPDSHVQGMVQCSGYYVLTHNDIAGDRGLLVIMRPGPNDVVMTVRTPIKGFDHPGGLQAIGDFLVVPVENSDHSSSYIHFYDASWLHPAKDTPPRLLPLQIRRESAGSSCVGITQYTDAGQEFYLLAVYNHGDVDFYRSNGYLLGDPALDFGAPFLTYNTGGHGYHGMSLLTEKKGATQTLYMLGCESNADGTTYKDRAILYKLGGAMDSGPLVPEQISRRHMITHHGAVTGAAGVHFRYGSGVFIRSSIELDLFATQRNFAGGDFTFNVFTP
jgi:hypothetical protein